MKRTATANWKGTGKEGTGSLSTQSGLLEADFYSSGSRFQEEKGTNPEELIAAAHAGCFSMKLSYILNAAGFTPDNITTKCTVTIESGTITNSHLEVKATIPGIDEAKFDECADEAKRTCPVSKALNLEITMEAGLTA
ncbi:MAG TPA: OsmC family protein [Saprospiraceae bacterium]|nr:OsmC family protein [Saprospiraceae bacterium]